MDRARGTIAVKPETLRQPSKNSASPSCCVIFGLMMTWNGTGFLSRSLRTDSATSRRYSGLSSITANCKDSPTGGFIHGLAHPLDQVLNFLAANLFCSELPGALPQHRFAGLEDFENGTHDVILT